MEVLVNGKTGRAIAEVKSGRGNMIIGYMVQFGDPHFTAPEYVPSEEISFLRDSLLDCYNSDSDYWAPITTSITNKRTITDVNIIVPNKVVEVTFADGTKTKSVCDESDTFSLETAISICISKKIMGGSSAYNKAIKQGVKVYEDKLKKEKLKQEEKERIERKRAKKAAYKQRRLERKLNEEKEKQIEIQKEAYVRAMRELNADK